MIFRTIPFFLQLAAWIPTRVGLFLRYDFTVRGRGHLRGIDTTHGIIFATNHISHVDPILVRAALPFAYGPLYYVSLLAKEYAHLPAYLKFFSGGFFFKLWGAYPVFRGVGDYVQSLRYHIKILEDRHSLCIFPNGGISDTKARPGIGFLAAHTDATIVPTRIARNPQGQVSVTFGKPFTFEELGLPHDGTKATFQQAAEMIMEKVSELASTHAI